MNDPITAEWLAEMGFRWSQFDRQPDRHWTLWLGWAIEGGPDLEDIGIELSPAYDGKWFCWFRSDTAGRYGRFVHVRHLRWKTDVIELIAGIVGRPFNPANVHFGALHTPERSARYTAERDRLDRRIARQRPWHDHETDATLGGARADHLTASEKRRGKADG